MSKLRIPLRTDWPTKLGALVAATILAAACSQPAPRPAAPAGSNAPACPPAQRAPAFTPGAPTARSLELVHLKGSRSYVVRDLTDILNVTTVSRLDDVGSGWQFAGVADLSYYDDQRIVRMPVGGAPRIAVACAAVSALAWNPTGTAAAYVTRPDGARQSRLHIISGGENRVADSMAGNPATGCEAYDCAERISVDLDYSPDGAYISYVESWGGPVFRLWTSDGKLVKSLDASSAGAAGSSQPGMSAWSGDSLYWRDAAGVERWSHGRQDLAMPGVAWIAPHASPGASLIVYMTRDNARVAHVWLLNVANGQVRELTSWRSYPAFLNSHLIWYQEERPCVAADPNPCPGSVVIPSGRTYVYDLQDGTETESVVQGVVDVWPRGG